MNQLKTENIGNEIYFHTIVDPRFKTNCISVNCLNKLDKTTVSENAILPFLLRKRSKDIPDITSLGEKLQELYGASFFADCNKIGDNQVLALSINYLADKFAFDKEKEKESISKKASDILIGSLLNPALENGYFIDEDIETEKQNVIELIESEFNEKRDYAINKAIEIMCGNDHFGLHRFGKVNEIKSLDKETITNAYKRMISSSQIHIIFVGESIDDAVAQTFKKAFKNIKRENVYSSSTALFQKSELKKEVEKEDVAQSKLALGFSAPANTWEEKTAMTVMNAVLGGTPISKLFTNVREKQSLCYYCAARYYQHKGIILIDSGVEHENVLKAKNAILEQIEDMKNGKFTDEQFEQTKLAINNNYLSLGDSANNLVYWYLNQISVGADKSPQEEIEITKTITRDMVTKAAKKVSLCMDYVLTGDEK